MQQGGHRNARWGGPLLRVNEDMPAMPTGVAIGGEQPTISVPTQVEHATLLAESRAPFPWTKPGSSSTAAAAFQRYGLVAPSPQQLPFLENYTMLQGIPFNYAHFQHTVNPKDIVRPLHTFGDRLQSKIPQTPTVGGLPNALQQYWSSLPL
jgi:hypothetical protein